MSQNPQLARPLGTRHRAAVGLTEETDAVAVVVSEETGALSVSVYGKLTRDLDGEGLRRVLTNLFRSPETKSRWTDYWRKSWKNLVRERSRE